MKARFLSLLAALLLCVAPHRAYALFGVGDIVFDPTAFAQLIKTYQQGGVQLQTLGSIMGINQQQLGTLNTINTAVGVVQGKINPSSFAFSQLGLLSQGLGIDANGIIGQTYQKSGPFAGALDVFMGSSIDSFRGQYANPWKNLEQQALRNSLFSIGSAVGLSSDEIGFVTTINNMTPEARQQNRTSILTGVATLMAKRFANAAEQRRLSMQAEVNISQKAAIRADGATTVNETGAATAEILAARNRMEAVAAQQQNEANEQILVKTEETNHHLQEINNRRKREEVEQRLNAQLGGNDY